MRAQKQRQRAERRAARDAVPQATREAHDTAIRDRLAALVASTHARVVSAFWPLVARGEVDLRPLLVLWQARGYTVALPRVTGTAPPGLAHHAFRDADALVPGPYGLLEPSPSAPLVSEVDLAVVPALALGRDGSRLGYGGGYYDTFLSTTAALRVGVVRSDALADAVPVEAHDARLDAVVTETETLWVGAPARPRRASAPRNRDGRAP